MPHLVSLESFLANRAQLIDFFEIFPNYLSILNRIVDLPFIKAPNAL